MDFIKANIIVYLVNYLVLNVQLKMFV